MFANSKQYPSCRTDYMFVSLNGLLDRGVSRFSNSYLSHHHHHYHQKGKGMGNVKTLKQRCIQVFKFKGPPDPFF